MTVLKRMNAVTRIVCFIAVMLFGPLSPSAAGAALHCAEATQMTTPTDVSASATMTAADHHTMPDGQMPCCFAICNLQSGLPPLQISALAAAGTEGLLYPDPAARLTGRPVSPAFEPPRLFA